MSIEKIVEYEYTPATFKPNRVFKKGSKYDSVLDKFNIGKDDMVTLKIRGVNANYLRTQLFKRINKKRFLFNVNVINGLVYLEKSKVVILKASIK